MPVQILEQKVQIPGREEVYGRLDLSADGAISAVVLKVIGGPDLLALAGEWRKKLMSSVGQSASSLPVPTGISTAEMLMRELILKLKGEWKYPYEAHDVCHCRVVSCEAVDRAIVVGAHTPKKVSDWTSASTACGTCRPDVEAMIAYRLGR